VDFVVAAEKKLMNREQWEQGTVARDTRFARTSHPGAVKRLRRRSLSADFSIPKMKRPNPDLGTAATFDLATAKM
jgi:hypothetical protein